MTADKTGAETTVQRQPDRFTISVDGRPAGFVEYADRGGQRVFIHTEVDGACEGRGLATILVGEALTATRDAGFRIVPVCELVAAYTDKHPEFAAVADKPTPDIRDWLRTGG